MRKIIMCALALVALVALAFTAPPTHAAPTAPMLTHHEALMEMPAQAALHENASMAPSSDIFLFCQSTYETTAASSDGHATDHGPRPSRAEVPCPCHGRSLPMSLLMSTSAEGRGAGL